MLRFEALVSKDYITTNLYTFTGARKECLPCRTHNYATVALDENMPDPEFLENPLDHLKTFMKVYDFQHRHRERLAKHLAEAVIYRL